MAKKSKYASQNGRRGARRIAATTSPSPMPIPVAPIPMEMNASPSAMISTRPVALREVRRVYLPARRSAQRAPKYAHTSAAIQSHVRALSMKPATRIRVAPRGPRREPEHGAEQFGVPAARKGIERCVHRADDEEGSAEEHALVLEDARNHERGDEHRDERNEQRARRRSSGSTIFVSQAYAAQAHQSAARTSTPRPIPANVGSSASSVATCVNAKTKTRSKKSRAA